jgi:hypothetical protein
VKVGERQKAEGKGQRAKGFLLFAFCFLLSAMASGQNCEALFPEAFALSYPGISIRFGNFLGEADVEKGPYTLVDGVCIENAEGVQLITVEATFTIVEDSVTIEARNVEVTFGDYELTADSIVSSSEGVELTEVIFQGTNLSGIAQRASYTFENQAIELLESSVRGQSLTIDSTRARLVGNEATFEDLTVTTCQCRGDPFYVVRSPLATFDLTTQTLNVSEGTLELIGLRLAFNNVTVSPETLRDFRFPVTIEYVPGNVEDGATGLGIRVPSLRFDDTLTLELGIVGLDTNYPLGGIFVIHFKDEKSVADIGLTPFGFQADFRTTEPLAPWLGLTFGVTNREWLKADFLHEGYASLDARTSVSLLRGDALGLSAQLLMAASSQTLPAGPVIDGRLAFNTEANYRVPPLPFGQFEFNTQTKLSYYPVVQRTQWGVRLTPRWRHRLGPASFEVSYTRQWTNAASPFSTKLDKLEPESRIIASTTVAGSLSPSLQGELRFGLNYNVLDVDRYFGEGFTSLSASGNLTYQINTLTVTPTFSLELAPLMNPDLDEDIKALLNSGITVSGGSWEAGFATSYDLELSDFTKIQTLGSFTVDVGELSLEPFLALNVLPTLTENKWPQLSGHGLEVAWRTCCGTLNVGYRQLDDKFTTTFAVTFEQPTIALREE